MNDGHRWFLLPALLLAAFVVGWLLLRPATTVQAATLTVTTLNDSGPGSLRQVAADAADGDTITFDVTGVISLTTGPITITQDIRLDGPGPDVLAISGNNASRVLAVAEGAVVLIEGLTVRDGFVTNETGGGIFNAGTLTLHNSTIRENNAASGGGIYNSNILTITDCIIAGNSAEVGGGIFQLQENEQGIIRPSTAAMTITSSTIIDNEARSASALINIGTAVISDTIIRDNSVGDEIGAIYNDFPTSRMTITNSIIRNNTKSTPLTETENPFCNGVWNFGVLSIRDTVISGHSGCEGAGLWNDSRGQAILANSSIHDNELGILNWDGRLTITESTISRNQVYGGINNRGGNLDITGSTISDNQGFGGIRNGGAGRLTLTNSTISGNHANSTLPRSDSGGAISAGSAAIDDETTTIIDHSTMINNTAAITERSGIWLESGTLTITHSILAHQGGHNLAVNDSANLVSGGYNLENGASGLLRATGDITGTAPLLNRHGFYGGGTRTQPPLEGSPVLDAIPADQCALPTDQRGVARPQDAGCDIGAVEGAAEPLDWLYVPLVWR